MKTLHILIFLIISCAQNIQSMESQQINKKNYIIQLTDSTQQHILDLYGDKLNPPTNDKPRFIQIKVDRYNIQTGEYFFIPQTADILSEQLYNHNLTEKEIDELVKQGANVNYKRPRPDRWAPDPIALPLYFAHNCTEQGVKNMQNLIKHGALLHDIPGKIETPLEIAVQYNYSPMIQLLLLHEKPITSSRQLQERRIREFTIGQSFEKENFESIKTLLRLKLITADQGIAELIRYKKSNPEIIGYLLDNGTTLYNNNTLADITQKALPISHTYLQILYCLINRGAFDEEALKKISEFKNFMIDLEKSLKKNSPK